MKRKINKKDLSKQKGITDISVTKHPQLSEEQSQHLNRLLAEIISQEVNYEKDE